MYLADGSEWKAKHAAYPDFFKDPRNVILMLCADGATVWKDKSGVSPPIYFQVLNLPPEIRKKFVNLELWGMMAGKPKNTTILYEKLGKCPHLNKMLYKFCEQDPPGSAVPKTDESIRRASQRHVLLITCKNAANLQEVLEEEIGETGVKFPSALARLPYFDLSKNVILDGMHQLRNLGLYVHEALLAVTDERATPVWAAGSNGI
ncbi:hypothetical protein CYMTET_10469 [Cymbomonas tetramitiformis]|uniref:Uncharacterized protein n=1 Tax=Cymbomonas tetramitiformis TaxID=36881 RepID=A0AAE0GP62_9CHLO|nr:hypothetical protein CYMTET_10469 [Cymbomonas tetramitiformis]